MAIQDQALTHLDSVEEHILALVPLQQKLRQEAQGYMDREKITLNEFAQRSFGTWKDAKQFLSGGRALSRGRFLSGLGLLLSQQELCKQIERESEPLQDRQTSVSVFPEKTIHVLFCVLRAHTRRAKTVTRQIFAGAFSPHHTIVLALFDLSHDALKKLCDKDTRNAIYALVTNDILLDREIESGMEHQRNRIGDLVRVLERLNHGLLPHYGGQYKQLAVALEIPETTFQIARHGEASEKLTVALIEKARALSKKHEPGYVPEIPRLEKLEKPTEEQRHVQPKDTDTSPQETIAIEQTYGGITASDGVRNCITEEQLNSLSLDNTPHFIGWATHALEQARWALNVAVKLQNPLERGQIRNALSKEVRELFLSLRAFEKENPGYIAPFIDAQRLTFLMDDEKEKHP